jgi:hypothetical protein
MAHFSSMHQSSAKQATPICSTENASGMSATGDKETAPGVGTRR